MTATPPIISQSLVDRVKNILVQPAAEWSVIKGETATVQSLFTGYAAILALVGPAALFLSTFLFGGFFGALAGAALVLVVFYALSLASTYAIGLLVDVLAPSFGGDKNPIQSMKVAVYSLTAAWVGGIGYLIPSVGQLIAGLAALYGVYLLFLGLQKVKDVPPDKAIVYAIVVFLIVAVAISIILTVLFAIAASLTFGAALAGMR